MSPRAACRLEGFGFRRVYHYQAGKADWFAYGLPMEGSWADLPKAIDVVRRDVPTCLAKETIAQVQTRLSGGEWKVCVVVTEDGIVVGRLRGQAWSADPASAAELVMENGPTTFRPDHFLDVLVPRMRERKVGSVLITFPDGVLVGLLFRKDGEAALDRATTRLESIPEAYGE